MQKVAAASQQFVPCASLLLEVLEEPVFLKKPKGSTAAPPDLALLVKLGKDLLEPRYFPQTSCFVKDLIVLMDFMFISLSGY